MLTIHIIEIKSNIVEIMNIKETYEKSKKGNEDTVVVEGVHAFKHASRFGAKFLSVVTDDKKRVLDLMQKIASRDDMERLAEIVIEIDQVTFNEIASDSLRTGLVAIAKKPQYTVADIADKQIVFIEDPRDIDNVGAVVRVAAGYGAGAVVISGDISPWHMMAIRAGAGLQWALPILQVTSVDDIAEERKVYACDADGKSMKEMCIEKNAVLVFGTERCGITAKLKKRADQIISIPMQKGVSSLNLATSVSAILFGGQFK